MHLLEQYSLSTGSTIDKPFIYEAYFPLPEDKYITFQAQSKFESKDYSYWQDVLNILSPILQKNNIKILQLGKSEEKSYEGTVDLRGKTSFNQLAYVMRTASLHFGPDSLGVHMASLYNVPIVGLYSIIHPEVAGPYFGDKSKHSLFKSYERTGNKKPSYSPQENPKSINLIKPEEIANEVLKMLGIDFRTPFETVFIGAKYSGTSIQESIPNYKKIVFNPEGVVEIRCDLGYIEECFINQLAQYKKSIVILDKPININILKQFKQNIISVIFKITPQDYEPFVNEVRDSGIKLVLISDCQQEEINKLKIKYYEYGGINKIEKPSKDKIEELKKDVPSLYYRSSKITASKDKFFYSIAAAEKENPMNNHFEYQRVIDSDVFWNDLEFFTIVKLTS